MRQRRLFFRYIDIRCLIVLLTVAARMTIESPSAGGRQKGFKQRKRRAK
jgi:hypothetical protein